jgi:hypothetical protein
MVSIKKTAIKKANFIKLTLYYIRLLISIIISNIETLKTQLYTTEIQFYINAIARCTVTR